MHNISLTELIVINDLRNKSGITQQLRTQLAAFTLVTTIFADALFFHESHMQVFF
jgi:hypothetical protein